MDVTHPQQIAIVVPEPSAAAVMLGAVGLASFGRRRRRRRCRRCRRCRH
jgi:hypothetical protein